MKILIISWNFPPHNSIAAVRLGKLSKFLMSKGHEIRVLTPQKDSSDMSIDASLEVEIPDSVIIKTKWVDIARIIHGAV